MKIKTIIKLKSIKGQKSHRRKSREAGISDPWLSERETSRERRQVKNKLKTFGLNVRELESPIDYRD